MKADVLKTKSADELKKDLLDLKKQQFNLRFQLSQGQLANTAQMRTVRRSIARVKTFMTQAHAAPTVAKTEKPKAAPKKATAKKTTPKKSEK